MVENRVIYTHIWGNFTFEELAEGSQTALNMIRAGQAPVHDIVDMREMDGFPKSIQRISETTQFLKEPNLGWFILLSSDRLVNFIAATVTQLSRRQFHAFKTMDETRDFLLKWDATLVWPT